MSDMLVRLYDLENCNNEIEELQKDGIIIKTAMSPDLYEITRWITKNFRECWAGEASKAILSTPSTCFIAVHEKKLVGFACFDATARGFFEPTGVSESMRGKGIGKVLLLKTLNAMYEYGYPYAIIGSAGPTKFYEKICGAVEIENSSPGYFRNNIKS